MTENQFEIQILDLHWIKNEDDAKDLCAHGHVNVRIANEIIANKYSLDVTLSSTALYLMRTIQCDYKKGDFGSQLLPCCGHFFTANDKKDFVTIIGCPKGIDWTIIHTDYKNETYLGKRIRGDY